MKVLVSGAGALLGQGVIRSLLESSLRPHVVAVDPSPLAVGLYWGHSRHLVPLANDPAYPAAVEAILERERPDAVLVGTDVELTVVAQHREQWEAHFGTRVIVSAPEVIRIVRDKWLTNAFLRERGFPVPESCLPGDEVALSERVGFPLVVKPRTGARSVGVEKVHNRAELAQAIDRGGNVVIQECVSTDSEEYTAGALVFDGRCEASIVMRRELRDGNTYRGYVDHYPDLNDQVRRLAEALGAYGPTNFQFRTDARGRAKVFEINGRFSGTTPLRMRAGFNEVEMVLRRVLLDEPITQPEVRPMTIVRWLTESVVPRGEEPSPSRPVIERAANRGPTVDQSFGSTSSGG